MPRNSHGSGLRRPGRPPKDITDALRARAWYWAVRDRAQALSSYALEKRFASTSQADAARPWVSTGNWRQYSYGRLPNAALVERVEAIFPGTQAWLDLPLWETIRVPVPSLERIHVLIASLSPELTNLLFLPRFEGETLQRRDNFPRAFRELDRQGDIAALTATMGLLREAEYRRSDSQHCQGAITALNIFLRLATFRPFAYTAPVILKYLSHHFFSSEYVHLARLGPATGGIDLEAETLVRNAVLAILEDFGVLSYNPASHRACLYLADRYGLGKAARELQDLYHAPTWKGARSAKVVRWFARRLKSFKGTVSCVDST